MLVEDILPHELMLTTKKKLRKSAAPPQLTTRLLKSLGTLDADAAHIEAQGIFDTSKLLAKAEAARAGSSGWRRGRRR